MRLLGGIVLQLVVSAAFMTVLLWRVDVAQLRRDLASADWRWLGPAFLLLAASQVLHGVRWWLVARRAGAVPLRDGVLARVTSMGVDLLLPFHPGFAALAQILHRRYGVERATAMGTLGAEGVTVLITLVVLALVFAPFVAVTRIASPLVPLVVGAGLAVGGLALWAAYRKGRRSALSGMVPQAIRGPVGRLTGQFASGFAALGSASSVLLLLLSTLAEWSAAAVGLAAVGQGFGLDVPLSAYVVAQIASYLSFAVPLTQGNLGPYELALGGTLVTYGADEDRAAAFALGAHAVVILATVAPALAAGAALRLRREDLFYLRTSRRQA